MENESNFQSKLQQDVKEKEKKLLGESSFLAQMVQSQNYLFEKASKEIVFSPPLVSWNEIGVFRKGTINVIQGKFGSHKSRFAELYCSLFLRKQGCKTHFLGFERDEKEAFAVCYIDTERNLDEEIPATIQNIRDKAGHFKTQQNPHFYVTSIKQFARKERLQSVKEWIQHLRKTETNLLFVVLDVVTDCVESFNSDGQSMELFDFLGNLCDEYKVTFLLLIHENFGTEKARGHTGSEAANKSACVIQISIEDEEKDLIKLKFIKLRSAARPQPLFLQYCPNAKGLVLAPDDIVNSAMAEKRNKTDIELVKEQVEIILAKPMTQKEVCNNLMRHFGCSENTIKNRLKQLVEKKEILLDAAGRECILEVEWQKGKSGIYYLKPKEPTFPELEQQN